MPMVMNPENCKFGHASLTCFASSKHSDGSTPDLAGTTSKLNQKRIEKKIPHLLYDLHISSSECEEKDSSHILYPKAK
jgi:hypothetical protein